jgi:hypothetical protein
MHAGHYKRTGVIMDMEQMEQDGADWWQVQEQLDRQQMEFEATAERLERYLAEKGETFAAAMATLDVAIDRLNQLFGVQ